MTDKINSPKHYTSHPSGVECIQVAEHMNFCLGNAMKYLWRAGLKEGNDTVDDLSKAKWYIEREINRITNNGYNIPINKPFSTHQEFLDQFWYDKT